MWLAVVGDGSRWQPVGLPIGTVLAVPVAGCTSVLQVGKIIFGARLVRQCASECAPFLPHDRTMGTAAAWPDGPGLRAISRSPRLDHFDANTRLRPTGPGTSRPSATAVPVIGVPGYPAGRRGGLRVVRRPPARRPSGQAARRPRATACATGVRLDLPVRCQHLPWVASHRD
jgi:hypothetical protein